MKFGLCPSCAKDVPIFKDYYVSEYGKKSRYKVNICMVCRGRVALPSKFHNKPTRSKLTGVLYQSKHEHDREAPLLAMQQAGAIRDLQRQVKYPLEVYSTIDVDNLLTFAEIAPQLNPAQILTMSELAQVVRRTRQKICNYIADFVYKDREGNLVVEDPKGARTQLYRIKKRLMISCHNVEIQEPSNKGVEQWARGTQVRGPHTGGRWSGTKT